MRLYKVIMLVIFMFSLTGCNVYKDKLESYQVYNTVLNQLTFYYIENYPNQKGFLFERQTSIISLHYKQLDREGNIEILKEYVNANNGIKPETYYDYVSKNKRPIYLDEKHLKGKYVLLDREDVNRYLKSEPDIYDKYRGHMGICTFSRVGFDIEKTQAVLFCEVGNLTGFIILNKRNDQWVIDNMWDTAFDGAAPNILR